MNSQKLINSSIKSICGIILFILLSASPLLAEMTEVSDSDLSDVSAQAGITYNWGNSGVHLSYDSFSISDSDHVDLDGNHTNWAEFNNITISGPDGYFTLDEANIGDPFYPFYRFSHIDMTSMTTIDGFERPYVQLIDATNTNQRDWTIGNFVFVGQDIGSIQFDERNVYPTVMKIATHGTADTGIEFEYFSSWQLNNFSYTYNATPADPLLDTGKLSITGIHIAESASGDPTDPGSWQFSGQFRIGDIYGDVISANGGAAAASNPATLDVATYNNGTDDNTAIFINLPMKGSIRAEGVNFGGANLGPVAIDGITVHHLGIKIAPGN